MQLRLPRPLWFAFPTVVLVVVAVALPAGIPAYRQWSAMQVIRSLDVGVVHIRSGPEFLRAALGENLMVAFDDFETITCAPDVERLLRASPTNAWTGRLAEHVVDDRALLAIGGLSTLRNLCLDYTNITDKGMEHVAHLQNLQSLSLDATDVSDASIPLLLRLTNLRELSLRGTRVSEDGVKELEGAMPGLKVTR